MTTKPRRTSRRFRVVEPLMHNSKEYGPPLQRKVREQDADGEWFEHTVSEPRSGGEVLTISDDWRPSEPIKLRGTEGTFRVDFEDDSGLRWHVVSNGGTSGRMTAERVLPPDLDLAHRVESGHLVPLDD